MSAGGAPPGDEARRASARTVLLPTLEQRGARYLTFFCTYLYQGLVAGFSLTALANHYAGLGVAPSAIGLHFAVAGLPWAAQPILWGPLVDRAAGARMGRRRIWGVTGILGAQASLLALWLVPSPDALGWIGAVLFLHSVFASLLDTACDRMIMDHVPDQELGRMSGCTRGGFVIGTSLGTAVFSWTLGHAGFAGSVALLVASGSAALILPLLVRESAADALFSLKRGTSGLQPQAPSGEQPALPSSHGVRAARGDAGGSRGPSLRTFLLRLFAGLRRPSALRLVALCFSLDFALSLFELRFNVEVVQVHGWDAAALSRLQAGLAFASGTLGAIGIGLWSDRAGPLPALRGLLAGGAVTFAVAAGLMAAGLASATAPVILGLTNVLPSLLVVALVPALMRASRGRAGAATRFEVFMAAMNLGSVAGGGVSGWSAAVLPTAGTAMLAALVFAGCAAWTVQPERLFGRSFPQTQ